MSEKNTQWKVCQKGLILIIFATLYSLGGLSGFGKELRRFVAPFVLCGGMFFYTKDWRVLVQYPFMCLSLSIGYGADATWIKILKRLSYGSANGLTFNIKNLWDKKWLWSIFHVVTVVFSYIMLGVWNMLPSARAEEFVLALILGLVIFQTKEE